MTRPARPREIALLTGRMPPHAGRPTAGKLNGASESDQQAAIQDATATDFLDRQSAKKCA